MYSLKVKLYNNHYSQITQTDCYRETDALHVYHLRRHILFKWPDPMSLSNIIQKCSVFAVYLYSAEIIWKCLSYTHTQKSVLRETYRPRVVSCDLKLLKSPSYRVCYTPEQRCTNTSHYNKHEKLKVWRKRASVSLTANQIQLAEWSFLLRYFRVGCEPVVKL